MINIRTIVTAKETLAAPKTAPNGRCSLTMIFVVMVKGDKTMDLDRAIKLLKREYENAKHNSYVTNPLAFALYNVWKIADKERR